MEKIILPRGGGKTDRLIQMSGETGAYIVCVSRYEADKILARSKEIGCAIKYPMTYAEFLDARADVRVIPGYLIDNIERFVQSLTIVPIMAITLTEDE